MIYLRQADPFDVRALAELREASLIEMGLLTPTDTSAFLARATRELARLFRERRIVAWVTCENEAIVGTAFAVLYDRLPYPEGSLHAEVSGVYVDPAYRRHGYAAEMVREVIDGVKASGARKMFLRPTAGAGDLYTKLGFEQTSLMTLG